jgi:hypothetical protein
MTSAAGLRRLPPALARSLPLVLSLAFPMGCFQSDSEPHREVDTFYSIAGTVTEAQTLRPLSGVEVEFGHAYGDSISYSYRAETDSAGTYYYVNLGCGPDGHSRVRFSKAGYETKQLRTGSVVVHISACDFRLDIAMEAAESPADRGEE